MKALKNKITQTLATVTSAALLFGAAVGITPESKVKAAAEETTKITLLGTSDIHGRFMPWDYAIDGPNLTGSLTQLFTMVKQVRTENPNTVLVDAGDSIQGNSAELFNDQPESPMMVAMNEMGYDAWAYGNHEFNFGLDTLDKVTSQFNAPMLAGNIYKEDGNRFLPAYTIVEKAGVKIGIIGMVTPMITEFERGTNHLDGLVVKNPVEETKKAVAELKGQVDVMVGVMHMGLENENGVAGTGVIDIANEVPELTAIFAGHAHQLVKKQIVNGVLISEPDKYGTHLSRIDLTFTKDQDGKLVLKDKESTALPVKQADGSFMLSDKYLEEKLKPFHEFARADANIVVAQLVGMNMVPVNEIMGIPSVQIQETRLADFFNEVMLHYSKADVVAHQIDNDNARLDAGPIKKKDISYNYQYAGGEITNYEITGKDLKDYMEWSAGYFNTARPGDVTISFDPTRRASKYSTNDFFGGIKYDIDLTEPYGSRIKNIRKMDGTPIKAEDVLTIGMNSYRMDFLVSKGQALEGRTFKKLWVSKDESAYGESGGLIRALAIRYLQEVKNGVYEPVIQENWRVLGADMTSQAHKDVAYLVNNGFLEVPKTADGKYTNIASINVNDPVTAEEIKALTEKANLPDSDFANVKNKGEFYRLLVQKLTGTTPDEDQGDDTQPGTTPGEDKGGTEQPETTTPGDNTGGTTAPGVKQPVADSSEKAAGSKLPETATNIYNLLGAGMLLIAIGAIAVILQRRTRAE